MEKMIILCLRCYSSGSRWSIVWSSLPSLSSSLPPLKALNGTTSAAAAAVSRHHHSHHHQPLLLHRGYHQQIVHGRQQWPSSSAVAGFIPPSSSSPSSSSGGTLIPHPLNAFSCTNHQQQHHHHPHQNGISKPTSTLAAVYCPTHKIPSSAATASATRSSSFATWHQQQKRSYCSTSRTECPPVVVSPVVSGATFPGYAGHYQQRRHLHRPPKKDITCSGGASQPDHPLHLQSTSRPASSLSMAEQSAVQSSPVESGDALKSNQNLVQLSQVRSLVSQPLFPLTLFSPFFFFFIFRSTTRRRFSC